MTHIAKVAWHRGHDHRIYDQISVVQETRKDGSSGRDIGRAQNATAA
jgi:hypothetical protein